MMFCHSPRATLVAMLVCLLPIPAEARQAIEPTPSVNRSSALTRVDPKALSALRWRNIGPARGGRSVAVAGVPGDPYTFYFGAVAGGVWKTIDAGQHWLPITDQTPISSVGAIAVAPSDSKVIYVGTGESDPRGDMTWGDGLYKSIDGGKTWSFSGLKDSRQIGAIAVDPKNPDIVLVAALGDAFGPNAERGVFRTTDGGKTWAKVLYKDEQTVAIDLTLDPSDAKTVWAALWQMRRQPWNFSSGGPNSGIYRSNDGGLTWAQVTGHGLPTGILGRCDISISGADSKRIYAMVEAKEGGLFRSDDGGGNWIRINDDGRLRQRAWYFSKIYADPKDRDTVYALNTGCFRSTDGGRTFKLLPAPHGDHHALWIDPTDPQRMINANDGGAAVSVDGGKTFSTQNNQPTGQFYHVATDNRFPYRVYGAQQDNSNLAAASYSDFGALTSQDWYPAGGGECGFVLPDPRDPDIIYSTSENTISRFNRHTMQSSLISVWPIDASGHAADELKHRFNWTLPLILSPFDSDTLYTGMERLYKTTDDGQHWTAISPDLTRNDRSKQGPSGGPITHDITSVEYYDTIFAVAESTKARGFIWVGTDDGLIHLTRDDGQHWQNVTPAAMPSWGTVSMIDPGHFDPGTAYVAVDCHKLDDLAPHAFKTHDAGKDWIPIDAGLPEGAVVHAVREDPVDPGLLYAATELGVFVSFDDGAHWQTLNVGLPRTPVHDLVVHDADLVIATHGRSFWILDDVTPLRQAAQALATPSGGLYLYEPERAYRLHYPDEVDVRPPNGKNPPAGALVDYYLPVKPAGPLTMEISDAKGQVIRHLSSGTSSKVEQPQEWPDIVQATDILPANEGLNRFVWDLRWDDPVQIPGAFYAGLPPRGPLALPGTYTLRMTYGGKTYTTPLRLVRDPRVTGAATGMEEKFALALAVYHDLDALHRAVNDLREIKTRLSATVAKGDASAKARGGALLVQAEAIEGVLVQVHLKGSEANLNYPGMLNEQIYGLASLLDDADTAPNQPEEALYQDLHHKLAVQLAAWRTLKEQAILPYLTGK